jgi:hypothetical protein
VWQQAVDILVVIFVGGGVTFLIAMLGIFIKNLFDSWKE